MNISLSLIVDVEDLYEDFLKHLGLSKNQYKKAGLKKGLSFKKGKELSLPCDVLRNGLINPVFSCDPVTILFEDENFLALSKPSNMHGHPQSFGETNTVLNFLQSMGRNPDFGGPERGLLYRLDKETSGVLVAAKNESTYFEIREEFNAFAKEKIYLAIVQGKLEDSGEIRHHLAASGQKGSKQKESEDGKEAILEINNTQYSSEHDCSLVEVSLKTGLRHQIRAQLSLLGHPILGDTLYGGKESERLFLHALRYSFDWEGQKKVFLDNEPLLFDKFFNLDSCL